MLPFLRQRWFLLTLLLGLGLTAVAPQVMRWSRWPDPRWVVGTALFLTAWTLPRQQLAATLRRPWAALWAAILSYGFVPPVAWVAGWLSPVEDFRVGLLIAASVPCTVASAVLWTRLAGGDDAVGLLVTLLTTTTSWLCTTTWLTLTTGVQAELSAAEMMLDLALALVLPLLLGQLAQSLPPLRWVAEHHKAVLSLLARCCILLIIYQAGVSVSDRLRVNTVALDLLDWIGAIVLPAGVHLVALGVGLWSSLRLGLNRPQSIAVAFACSQKTLPVSLLLFERYYAREYPLAVVPLAFYHFGQLIFDTFVADWLRPAKPSGEAP